MHITTKLFTAIFATLSTCSSIICGTACDFIEVGECAGSGGLFGPCDDHLALRCLDGLTCTETKVGNICTPSSEAADDFGVAECAAWRGMMACSQTLDSCFLACDGPDACKGGTVCDENAGMCVYPYEPLATPDVGEPFGPCNDDDTCVPDSTCIERTYGAIAGNICLPSCKVCGEPDVILMSGTIGTLAPSCTLDSLCATPCSTQDDCLGDAVCMEGVCFRTDVLL